MIVIGSCTLGLDLIGADHNIRDTADIDSLRALRREGIPLDREALLVGKGYIGEAVHMDTYVATRELGAGERQVIIVGISFLSTIGLDERQIAFIILSSLRRCEATAVDGDTLARIADK